MTTFSGPSPDEVEGIGSLTLGGFLDEVAARFAGDEAVVFDDPLRGDATLRWTYADLRAETRQIAKALIAAGVERRSEEHTSELQSLMRISYAVFCLKKKNNTTHPNTS